MRIEANLGNPHKKNRTDSAPFRLAVLGDFSGRANKGALETGEALAKRKPLNVDFDNIDDVIARLNIALDLPIGANGSTTIRIREMDDFHPDQLYQNLEIFTEIANLRDRLGNTASFAAAAKEVQEWLGDETLLESTELNSPARGATIPASDSIDDFAKLIGEPTVKRKPVSAAVELLLKSAVAPYIQPSPDPRQESMVAEVDRALSGMMRSILHHPDFQAMESIWRSVEMLTQRLETDTHLQIILYDITAEELAADLTGANKPEESGLYQLLVEQPAQDGPQGRLSAISACYTFEQTASHAELLDRIAQVVSPANTAFIASVNAQPLDQELTESVQKAWNQLAAQPGAECLALTTPKFMLRIPYGKKSDPIDTFEFEEFATNDDFSTLVWGHSSILTGLSLGLSYTEQGMENMDIHANMTISEMPYHFYNDSTGDQIALPCTERLFTETAIQQLQSQNLIPIVAIKGQPKVQLGSWVSLNGKNLAGPWAR